MSSGVFTVDRLRRTPANASSSAKFFRCPKGAFTYGSAFYVSPKWFRLYRYEFAGFLTRLDQQRFIMG
ncbi:hypothetical protein Dsin_016708 [Dipteronia sinensis]|uniref:Uncharacterized protein n=1 Tax=Dipteronia sinensis TaxID=43782 RepID=A0AAE0E602_9ROSI|nr:hypothetical protein Dsin_016708 [Dipteronia sinensis]